MPRGPESDHMLQRLVLVFFLLTICIGLIGYRYYYHQKQLLEKDIRDELSVVADLKVDQIVDWRKALLHDAMVASRTPFLASAVRQFLSNPESPTLKQPLLDWIKTRQDAYSYKSVLIVDTNGAIRLSPDARTEQLSPMTKKSVDEALRTKQAVLSDIHVDQTVDYVHLDLIAPLLLRKGQAFVPVAALVIHVDPGIFLYPLIQSWPGTSKTAETLIVRRDKDSVLFLNELRNQKNTALSLRIPLSKKQLPAAMAIQGQTDVFEGVDYREVPVLAALRPVPQTPWFLVAKVDIEEVYAPNRDQARFMFFIVISLIASAGLSTIFWWRQKSSEYAHQQSAYELERKMLSQQHDFLSKFANDIILLLDAKGDIVEANDRALASYGYSRDELLRLNARDIRPPETRHNVLSQMQQVQERNGLIFETVHRRKDGTTFPVEVSSRVMAVGGKSFYQSIIRDITERRQAETVLRERNLFIEAVLSNLPIGLAVNNTANGRVIYMNSKFEEIYGWSRDILVDVDSFFSHVYPDPAYRREIKKQIFSDIASGDPLKMRWDNVSITTQRGETKFVAAVNIPILEQGLMISTVLDITSRRKAEQAMIDSERRYKRLVESVTDYIYSVGVENGCALSTLHGPGCVNVTGYTTEEYHADPNLWYRMIFEEDRAAVIEQANRLLTGAQLPPLEHRIIHKDGSIRWIKNTSVPRYDEKGNLIAYDGMVADVTQLKLLENQLRQAQKMEAVGQLAGGVAHDFNNILTAIIGYANLLLMKLPPQDANRPFVNQILTSSERAAHLTHSLLAFSRKQVIDPRPVDLNDIIKRVERLLGRVIGEDIEFKTRLSDTNLWVMADSIQVEQVLMNLAANARDAMPNGGTLLIETEPLELGEEYIRTHSYGTPGNYAFISVSDTGIGMDEATRSKIFEPFFTTKEVGKGTGLGLSMVYGIIKQHNGFINVYSEPGKGTTFKIYLPLIASVVKENESGRTVVVGRGTETVLLAEDDEPVRNLTRHVLEDFGYMVIEAADGEEAVRKFKEKQGAVDLLVLDIVMPKKNGKEVYQEIKSIRPAIKALFTSGYTADIVRKKGILDTGMDFVLKPITPTDFLKKVREVLDKQ